MIRTKPRTILCVLLVILLIASLAYILWILIGRYEASQFDAQTISRYVTPISVADDGVLKTGENDPKPDFDSTWPAEIQQIDFPALQAVSDAVVGWIQIPSLPEVNYPIVWCDDADYFLTHAWNGKSSRSGAIFIEPKNNPDLSDCYTILYGHNMKDGSMFGSLRKYRVESFYEEAGGIMLIYLPGETRLYQIFSVESVDYWDPNVYTVGYQLGDDAYADSIQGMQDNAIYDTGIDVSARDSVITLSTCAQGDKRLVIHGVLIDKAQN